LNLSNKNIDLYDFIKIPSHDFVTGHFSCFTKGLMYSREATGRDPKTGKKTDAAKLLNIAGALGYFALLEQIGNCFKPKSSILNTIHQNNIHKALRYFSSLNSDEIFVVRALRNTFSHDFSLYGTDKGNKKLLHHFKLVFSDTEPLMILRKEEWDGDIKNKTNKNITIVNLEKLCDIIDNVCIVVQEMARKNELEIVLIGGFKEYYEKYSINIQVNLKLYFTPNSVTKKVQIKK